MNNLNNLEEYTDPILYDLENKQFEPDGPFYLALAKHFGSPVLEIGCGTGRITIPIAQAGINITGLDVMPPMLELARQKSRNLPIHWQEADARSYSLPGKFRFIFESGATFQHMLERSDQEAFLTCVRRHLEPEGYFVICAMMPSADMMADEPDEKEWFSFTNNEGQVVRVSGTQYYDRLKQVKTETAYRRWTAEDGKEMVRIAPLMLRLTFPQEMETLLHYNGLNIKERYGDYDFGPLTRESRQMIFVCQQDS
jgi:SAM-dependent methyltransferase